MRSTKHEHTNILPLRWFANGIEFFAHYFLIKALRLDESGKTESFRYKIYAYLSNKMYKPVIRWGTYYTLDKDWLKEIMNDPETQELMEMLGSDYDENGIPYWIDFEEDIDKEEY